MNNYGKIALFVGGTLFGSAGIKLLTSKDAKKAYTQTTAAVLRCRDQVMRDVELVQENCADILADGGCTASYWYGDLQYLKATH